MRLSPARRTRRGFTLLEVLLASMIALLLLGALYFAMDLTVRQTQDARDAVEIDNVSRGVFNRMSLDVSSSLGPLPPKSGGNANAQPAAPADPAAPTTPTDPAAPAADPAATTDPAATETTDPASAAAAADVPFQAGVIGTDKQFSVFVARTPDGANFDPNVQGRADLRRITYWLGANGGLCRQERPWVTADGIRNSVDPDMTFGEENDVIAAEVKDVVFEYFDGSGWAGSWDGSILGPDGVTPQGPPRAVKATLTLEFPASRNGQQPTTRTVTQVIPIRAAPGTYTPTLLDPYAQGTTTEETTTTDPATGGTTTPASGGATTPATTAPATTTPATGGGTTSKGGR
ncbi:MAG TPA: prepilin-type N-terminal cleavage/methylation domain-containing protein [Gemmataceae bacterium]|nr:prepilin-type N-terminal cleavage/methylation domain-containing protein [Gemmataceae bacterium]